MGCVFGNRSTMSVCALSMGVHCGAEMSEPVSLRVLSSGGPAVKSASLTREENEVDLIE